MRATRATAAAAAVLLTAALAGYPGTAHADGVRDGQWYLDDFDIAKIHELSQGAGVTIGVIDDGVDPEHPDLKGKVAEGTDLANDGGGDDPSHGIGHGTAVASVAAGSGHGENNDSGVLGIAPKAEILPVNVFEDEADNSKSDVIADAIRWLVDNGADIITISLGRDDAASDGPGSIEYANDKGVPVIASSGNFQSGTDPWGDAYTIDEIGWPAKADGTIPVTGIDQSDKPWDKSIDLDGAATQPQLGLSAPATDIPIALPGGKYDTVNGTSFSAPIVAGTLALIKSAYPHLDRDQVDERLLYTVDDKGDEGFDDEYGWGIVNPYKALTSDVDHYIGDPSTQADILPLAEQGKTSEPGGDPGSGDNPADGEDDEAGSLAGTANTVPLWAIIAIAAAVLLIAAVALALILRRNKKPTGTTAPPPHTQPPGNPEANQSPGVPPSGSPPAANPYQPHSPPGAAPPQP